MTFNASKKIQDLRTCVEIVYADTRKFRERPALSAYYAAGGPTPSGGLAERRRTWPPRTATAMASAP
jgi:hypothetical protein